ncbi:complement receptor type 2-like [Heteronotia binoei]|uniref:complement receptor type 2-like n=1 Tax=Heteronotia binoei TaxID=13085 RepID=UPI00292DA2BD|nr:complement receptor type 2-like [Heteronotia binoei]
MEKVTFECDHGYILKGNTTIQCQPDSRWDFPVPLCVRVMHCHQPPQVQNGFHSNQELAVFSDGMSVKYTCEHGYTLIGEATIYCTESGTWTLPAPHCKGEFLTCVDFFNNEQRMSNCLPSILNGHGLANFPIGIYVNYTCNPGYLLIGDASSHCTISGAWSQPIAQCEVMRCPLPPRIAHGSYFGADFTYQMSVIYVCDAGYFLVGNPMVTYTLQGSGSTNWSEPPQCKGCLAPEKIANGKPDTEILKDFAYGSSVTYLCDPGYFLTGAATIYCLSSGIWEPPVPQCKDKGCIRPEIQNGGKTISKLQFKPKETITFECAPGYILKGNNTIECQSDSTWDLPVPLCVRAIGCVLPQIPGSKKASIINMFQSGDNMTVQCGDGYVLEGSPYIQCQHDFVWDPPVPVCKPGFYFLASISFGK